MTADEELTFDPDGRNNLFPLVRSFRVLATLCGEIRATDPARFARPDSDVPHFAGPASIEWFPFRSKHPLVDLRASAADAIIASLVEVEQKLDRAGALDVRNRIPHNREPFPTLEEIEQACTALSEVVENLESTGMFPDVYLYEQETEDRFGRGKSRLVNSRGRVYELHEPSPVRMSDVPERDTPQVIFKAARLPDCSDVLRFAYQEKSVFRDYWRDFPVPRRIQISEDEPVLEPEPTLEKD
jgi:hypothetical protein